MFFFLTSINKLIPGLEASSGLTQYTGTCQLTCSLDTYLRVGVDGVMYYSGSSGPCCEQAHAPVPGCR